MNLELKDLPPKKAGRPKGAKNNSNVLKLRKFITIKEIERFIDLAKKQAESDPVLLKFILEQIFGKAPQSVDMTVTPQQMRFASLENQLKLLSNDEPKYIEGEIENSSAGRDALPERQGGTVSIDTHSGEIIRPDMETAEQAEPRDVPHEIREELCGGSGGADQDSDISGEVGDSSPIGEEGEDNHELPD